jgi:glycosyltransferase involved in cell wall biosynthesis
MRKRLRIFYAAGPGNVIGTYRHWKQRRDDPSQLAVTYSGQFYEVVNELGAKAYVIASCPVRDRVRDNQFQIEHWPIPFEDHAGPLYHLGQFIYGMRLLIAALLFRSDIAVVCGGTHWFILSLMSMCGIRVVPSLHCMLWRTGTRPGQFGYAWVRHLLRKWDGWFFRNHTVAILSVSAELTSQIRSLQTSGESKPLPTIHTFTPIYRRGAFDRITPAPVGRPFRVLYIGRIERNKGVFDMSRVALRLANEGHTDIEFDLCGSGSAMAELRRCVEATGIGARFRLHGHCNQKRLAGLLSDCHAVIAPTQCDFLEGFNKVVVEGVLSHRPVITSSICPSLSLVRDAALEVQPNDVQGYGDAIIRLRDDPELYNRLVEGGRSLSAQFYDESISWGETLHSVLRSIWPVERGYSDRRRFANRLPAAHGHQSWPARMSYVGIIAAVVMGLMALVWHTPTSRAGRQHSMSTITGTTHAPAGTTSLAMHHSATGNETRTSLTVLP